MSMNDYATQLLVRQHHQELLAVAANDRLGRIARSGQRPWWQRLLARPPASTGPAVRLASDACLPSRV